MDLKLKGKWALVTGSTQGIGFAIARGLAGERGVARLTGPRVGAIEQTLGIWDISQFTAW
jgi:NAD(P)-dependent dehydrogenase (short-subunit alcohol dehydrogenase family)